MLNYRLNHNQGSTDIFAMLQTLNLRLTPFIVAIMMLNHATTPPVSVIYNINSVNIVTVLLFTYL